MANNQCKRCGFLTEHYNLCDECIVVVAAQMVKSGRAKNHHEAIDKIYDDEVDAMYAAKGY